MTEPSFSATNSTRRKQMPLSLQQATGDRKPEHIEVVPLTLHIGAEIRASISPSHCRRHNSRRCGTLS